MATNRKVCSKRENCVDMKLFPLPLMIKGSGNNFMSTSFVTKMDGLWLLFASAGPRSAVGARLTRETEVPGSILGQ